MGLLYSFRSGMALQEFALDVLTKAIDDRQLLPSFTSVRSVTCEWTHHLQGFLLSNMTSIRKCCISPKLSTETNEFDDRNSPCSCRVMVNFDQLQCNMSF